MPDFTEDGVEFSYPENWILDREEEENGWTVTVQSPTSAFALLRMDRELPEPAEVVEATLEALRADYPDLEAEPALEMMGGEMALGHDIQFFSELMGVTCWIRCAYAGAGTLLLMCQYSDPEEEIAGSVLRAICASLRVEE